MRIHLMVPETQGGWRWSVWLECGRCGKVPCNFIGHANGWLEAQKVVKEYLAAI